MRRAVLAAVIVAAAVSAPACSPASLFGDDDSGAIPVPTAQQSGPLPSSQQFDRPFPVSGESWDATVTLSNLRIVPSTAYSDAVVVVDVRVVQASGQPELGPDDFSAFDPSGRPFERIESPAGTIDDPLVPSVLSFPGEEIRGMVAWTMPRGHRIGRIDLVAPRTIGSVTVTRQPEDPTAA
ncbi:hypothetical protein [Dietzia psychralcaliphila]|uniref:DUF4352 domain-containing protein n=1 Tax=Dietzia psychralcaliphila TaxID=139021 RepID=A0AAD0JTW6_9ACTN|nr:hypothetical protein [Dietzia psychralcaliphila]AWH95341.1 hypothetical protein A6048_07375 [Dietzia psychralcaliphila]PTM85494.1 hypothetical protein C8N39_11162 [Dietzia psychralcaliphila]